MSWISLILFPALLYCHLLNVELRHNVDGVPRQLCTLPTTPRFTCPHFPSLAFVPFPSASSTIPQKKKYNPSVSFNPLESRQESAGATGLGAFGGAQHSVDCKATHYILFIHNLFPF